MKKKQFLTLIAALLVLSCLFGCGADSGYQSKAEAGYDNGVGETMAAELSDSVEGSQTATPVNQKLIRTIRMNAETEDMDALLSNVEARIGELGGYVEARNVYNGTSTYTRRRSASLTIRIPAEKLDLFVTNVSEVSNVITHTEETKDVTLTYVSTESRVKALETEETRLLELVAVAEDLDDLLTLETRLTKIRTELEEHKSKLRVYDSLVSYGTIYLQVEEVVEYTVVEEEEPEKNAWQRMGEGFMDSLKALGSGLTELVIFLVSALPFLIPLGIIAVIVILAYKKKRK